MHVKNTQHEIHILSYILCTIIYYLYANLIILLLIKIIVVAFKIWKKQNFSHLLAKRMSTHVVHSVQNENINNQLPSSFCSLYARAPSSCTIHSLQTETIKIKLSELQRYLNKVAYD